LQIEAKTVNYSLPKVEKITIFVNEIIMQIDQQNIEKSLLNKNS
jgi:hypothetical protein